MGNEKIKRCVIFGGMIEEIPSDIANFILPDTLLICADRGYLAGEKLGIKPNLIVGDFDSAEQPKTDIPIIKLPQKKDDTDLIFAVKEGIKLGCNRFVISGVTGGRLDHTFASLQTLQYILSLGCEGFIYDFHSKVYITNSSLTLKKPKKSCYFSVFPFGEIAKGVSIIGGEYPLENADLNNSFPLGVSNSFRDDEVTVSVDAGTLLIMVVENN